MKKMYTILIGCFFIFILSLFVLFLKNEGQKEKWDSTKPSYLYFNQNAITKENSSAKIKGTKVTIVEEGTYILSGTLENGQVIVDTKGTVHLVFNTVNIHCDDSSPIYIKKSKKTIIELKENTENQLSDGNSYITNKKKEPDGTIFSEDDLEIIGTGHLTIQANYQDGIVSKNLLKLESGTIEIHAKGDGIRGKNQVELNNPTLSIFADGDGMKTSNETDANQGKFLIHSGEYQIYSKSDGIHAKGMLIIENGNILMEAKDDGIHADQDITIQNGTIHIQKSYEGIEGNNITIQNGNISIFAEDDGINGASKTDAVQSISTISIYGGNIYIEADGDGIDSNGKIEMTDGIVIVNGPTNAKNGAIDFDTSFLMQGGILVAAGSKEMAQTPSIPSSQNSLLVLFPTVQEAGTTVHISSTDQTILTFKPKKKFQSIVISINTLETNKNYTISYGGEQSGNNTHGLYLEGNYVGGQVLDTVFLTNTVTQIGA